MICSKFINDPIYQVDLEYINQSKMPTKISKLYPENIIKLHWNKTTLIKLWNFLGLLKQKDPIFFKERFILYYPVRADVKKFSVLMDWAPDFNKANVLEEVKWYSSLEFFYTAIETDINQKNSYKFLDFNTAYVQIIFHKKINMYYEILTAVVKRAKADFLQSEIDEFHQYVLKKLTSSSETLDD